jgi:hypothetical protein
MRMLEFIKSYISSYFRINKSKKIDIKKLPSQGFFYADEFEISIRKATPESIEEYEKEYDPEDLGMILSKLKNIVSENVVLPDGYTFSYIKSIDVVFIFLEIVAMTKNRPVQLEYYNDEVGMIDKIDFNDRSFNYFIFDEEMMKSWIPEERCFQISGYKFTLPSIGVENSLTNYLISKSSDPDALKYNDYSYSFTYFLGNREFVTFDEIDNLIEIFNSDLDEEETEKVESIVADFQPLQRYSLIRNGRVIEMSSKINLQEIWK